MMKLVLLCAMVGVAMCQSSNTRHFLGFGGNNFGGGGGFGGGSTSCRYWCRTPYNQYYCCQNGANNLGNGYNNVKPGRCPPVRPVCPPTRAFGPPRPCSGDSSCGGSDKCCYDTCLGQRVCKPPQFFG